MSKSTKRTFVPNNSRAIFGAFVRKRSLVERDQLAIETDLQSTPKTQSDANSIIRIGIRTLVGKSLRVQADRSANETDLQPMPTLPSQSDSTRKEGIGSDLTTIPQRPTIGDSMNESPIQLQSTSPAQELPKKKTRGKNRGLNADKVHEMFGRKIPITVDGAIGRPTCQYAEMFASEIGFVVRNYAPMNVEKWKNVTSQDLSKLVKRLSTKFEIDMTHFGVHRYVHKTFSTCFTNFRNTLKNYFMTFPTLEEALKNRHKQVKSDEEWAFLCNYFSSEKFKALSEKNARNRSKLQYHHKAGSKSFMSHAVKSVEALGAIELFASEYCSAEKGWDLGAKQKYDEMKLLQAKTTLEDGTRTMTDEEICKQVLGTKSGYIKGYGFGPRPTPIKLSQSSWQEMHEKNKALEDKIKDQNAQIIALTETVKKMEQFMAKFTPQLRDS